MTADQEDEFWQIVKGMRFVPQWSAVDGTIAVSVRLRAGDGRLFLEFLLGRLGTFEREIQRAAIFLIAQRLAELGDTDGIRGIYSSLESQLKAAMLQGLADAPESAALVVFELGLDALVDPAIEMRSAGCRVVQCASQKIDAQRAVPLLQTLVSDPSEQVRMHALCAVGTLAKTGYPLEGFVTAILPNLLAEDWGVRTYGVDAIWKLSKKHDISESFSTLAKVLLHAEPEWEEARKNAVGALLHFARKSPAHSGRVFRSLPWNEFDHSRKEIQKLAKEISSPGRL